jgi:outer membrane protein assembly factor BamD (BamD/ComL family)
VTPEYAGRDYRQAHAVFDRLVRQHPDSPHAAEARAWRELLGLYVALDQELQRRTHELQRRTQELLRRTQDLERLKRLDIELERPRSP